MLRQFPVKRTNLWYTHVAFLSGDLVETMTAALRMENGGSSTRKTKKKKKKRKKRGGTKTEDSVGSEEDYHHCVLLRIIDK